MQLQSLPSSLGLFLSIVGDNVVLCVVLKKGLRPVLVCLCAALLGLRFHQGDLRRLGVMSSALPSVVAR